MHKQDSMIVSHSHICRVASLTSRRLKHSSQVVVLAKTGWRIHWYVYYECDVESCSHLQDFFRIDTEVAGLDDEDADLTDHDTSEDENA